MAKVNINNIENVEGEYHLMFFEGKKIIENAKNEIRSGLVTLLFFVCFFAIFVSISGINLFYIGFIFVFLVAYLISYIYLKIQKHVGVKQCVRAVQNSKASEIVARQVDNRGRSKAIVKSMSSTLDKYDTEEKFPTLLKKYKRKRRHDHIVEAIERFEKEEKKSSEK